MKESAGGDLLEQIPGGWRVACLEVLAHAQLELGRVAEARRTVEAAEAWSEPLQLPIAMAMAHIARARLALATGDAAQAVACARVSMEAAGGAGAAFEEAVSRVVLGRALGEAGERQAAVAELTQAVEDLERFGALRHRKQAEQELRRLGERVHRRTRAGKSNGDGIATLTERELEIARLVADRLTNRQIAERLFLSQKTVETHMRNVFAKLGVNSRVRVARSIEQADRQT
jgi:ATP/maltotriose-dependent transcriptional regulator MalT